MTATEGLLAAAAAAAQNGSSSYATPTVAPPKFGVNDIVINFAREYYTMLSCEPERLHYFYGKQSKFLHCHEEELDASVCVGLEEIHGRLMFMEYNGARVVIANIDCQPSMNGGILIFVLGTMHWPKGTARKFAQTFVLAEQPNGYFVLNDILRILSPDAEVTVKSEKVAPKPASKPSESKQTTPDLKPESVKSQEAGPIEVPKPIEPKSTELGALKKPEVEKAPEKPSEVKPVAEKKKPVSLTPAKKVPTSVVASGDVAKESSALVSPLTQSGVETPSTTPSSWAKLAAVQQNRWQSGVVAESKGASIPVEADKPVGNQVAPGNTNNPRMTYRTNGDRRDSNRSERTGDNKDNSDSNRSRGEGDRPREKRPVADFDASKSVYVSNIYGRIDRESLRKKFEAFGRLKAFDVVISKGIAFVEYETVEAQEATLKVSLTYNDAPMKIDQRRAPARSRDNGASQQRRPYTRESRNENMTRE